MNRLAFGRYWPGESFWHRRDPLVKVVLAAALILPAAAARNTIALSAAACGVGLAWVTARLPFRFLIGALRSFSWLIAITIVANLFLTRPGGGAGWAMRLTPAGAAAAGLNALRIVILLAGGAWLTGTTSPFDLMGGLGRVLRPLGRLGLPSGELVLVVGLGFRLLPDLLETGGRVRLAQQARGVGVGRTWRARLRGAEALAMALFVYAFRRADELALAMEVRGFRPGQGLRVKEGKFTGMDLFVLAAGLGMMLTLVWLGRR
ncbi:MAG: energy-coupling factor transporter transmembrane component T family protein [Bacteroidota bacterium]